MGHPRPVRFHVLAGPCPKGAAMFLATTTAVAVALLGAVVLHGAAECTSGTSLGDWSVRGSLRAVAGSTQDGCSGRTMRVFLWLDGEAASCSGATWSSKCYDSSETGNAATSLWINRWGSATARSEHNYIEDNQTTDLADRELILEAGEPEEDNGGYSPIIIATGTSGAYRLTSAASGVLFDIDGDGAPERVAWTEADAEIAFLALDRDGDGFITSGKELFGDATLHGSSNGFAALARMNMETNGGVKRGSVSSEDPLFARLLLWTDSNHNGISEFGELRAASEYLSDIGLSYADHHRKDGHGNLYRYRGWVHRRTAPGRNRAEEPGEGLMRRRQIFDVWLTTLR